MAVRKAKRLAISAALLAPQLASARVPSRVEAGALIPDANGQSAIPSSTWRLAPAAGYRGSRGSIAGATSAWIDNQNWQLVDGSIGGTLVGPTIYGVRAELIGNASRAFDERSLGSDQVDVQTRINIQFNKTSGAWLGGGVARPWRVMVVSWVRPASTFSSTNHRARGSGAEWRARGASWSCRRSDPHQHTVQQIIGRVAR